MAVAVMLLPEFVYFLRILVPLHRRVNRHPAGCAGPPARAREAPMPLPDSAGALARAGRHRRLAEQALADVAFAAEDALAVLRTPDPELPALLWAAFAVRRRWFGARVKLCVLQNARSGLCPEDCGYCSQSAISS